MSTQTAYRIEPFCALHVGILRDLRVSCALRVYPPLAPSLRDYTRSASNPKIWGRFLIWILKIGDVFGVLSRFSRKNEAMTAESLCMPTCLFPLMKTKENDEFTWSDASFLWFNLSIPAQLEGERKDRRRLGPCMWGKKLKCCPDFSIQFQIVNQCFLSK